jgi:hypothetical protein
VLATRDGTRPGRSLQARCDPGRARARLSTSSGRRLLDVLLIRFSVLSQLHACKSRLFADGMPTLARTQGVSSDPDYWRHLLCGFGRPNPIALSFDETRDDAKCRLSASAHFGRTDIPQPKLASRRGYARN